MKIQPMEIKPIAYFRSPVGGKFALPRQAGLAPSLHGRVVLEPGYRSPEALRGLEEFDYVWLLWGFHLNRTGAAEGKLTVRPPRLGGNTRMGVFATRSPYRPNPIGLSSVRLTGVDASEGILEVRGADLADGTPIYDIKPYVEYADSHPGVRSGFADAAPWECLEVSLSAELSCSLGPEDAAALTELIAQDPRPQYQHDPERTYRLTFKGRELCFRVDEGGHAEVFSAASVQEGRQ